MRQIVGAFEDVVGIGGHRPGDAEAGVVGEQSSDGRRLDEGFNGG
jgi:hypothetical protein